MKTRGLTYIVSDVNKSLAFEWIAQALKDDFILTFIIIGRPGSELANIVSASGVQVHEVNNSLPFFSVWYKVFKILNDHRPDIIHTHLWRANLVGLSCGWLLRIPMRVMTRHHALIHYRENPSGRKWDLLLNSLATDIVAISRNVENILLKKDRANPRKITVVPHGFKLEYFETVSNARVERIRSRLGLQHSLYPVIGVISRHVEWKGIQYIIPSFAKLRERYPTAHLVLSNASGNYRPVLQDQLQLLPANCYSEIEFENDVAALYKCFDIFVHTPVDPEVEAFGQTYIEALAAGIPSVFTLSGISAEFIVHDENAVVAGFCDSDSIFTAICRLLENDDLRLKCVENGRKSVGQYQLDYMIDRLKSLYCRSV